MPGETDAQRFSNCPKNYILKLETPGGPTSILNGKRGVLLQYILVLYPTELRRAEMLGHFFSSQLTPCVSGIMLDKIQIEWLNNDRRGFPESQDGFFYI